MIDGFAMPQGAATLVIEKLEGVAIDIEAIERLIASDTRCIGGGLVTASRRPHYRQLRMQFR
jgi:hypothetical protein